MDTILVLLQSYRAREARPGTSTNLSMVMKMESEAGVNILSKF